MEVIFAGCVPVMISDKWELPFEDPARGWSSAAVWVSEFMPLITWPNQEWYFVLL